MKHLIFHTEICVQSNCDVLDWKLHQIERLFKELSEGSPAMELKMQNKKFNT